jgi:putative flippase GtrA
VTVLAIPTAQPGRQQPGRQQPGRQQPSRQQPSRQQPSRQRPALGAVPSQRRQLTSFAMIGTVTTVAYLLLYAVLQPQVGDQIANAIALLLTVDANTVANRRLSFGLSGSQHAVRHRAQGWVAFGVSLAATSASLAALHAGGVSSGSTYLAVLVAANLASGILHFVLLRCWAFARR